MIDIDTLKASINLLELVGSDTSLKKVASTGGGEWAGACPFCGGKDRFRVQPYNGSGIWLCRHCSEKWTDAITYVQKREGCDFKQACSLLGGAALPPGKPRPRPETPAYSPPCSDWQAAARQVLDVCQENLWSEEGAKALEYLRGRGLRDEVVQYYCLGYSPGAEIAGLWVPRGVVIPCLVRGEVWYLKIRLPAKPGEKKYTCVKGSRPAAIFGADDLLDSSIALFCEGEFDAMIASQEIGKLIPCVTLGGSATNRLDLATWGAYLLGLRDILVCYDADPEGEQGSKALLDLSDRVKTCPLPDGHKDINDFYLSGGNLELWLLDELERVGALAI
jgi:DNA primase